jgi:hypothetical protein
MTEILRLGIGPAAKAQGRISQKDHDFSLAHKHWSDRPKHGEQNRPFPPIRGGILSLPIIRLCADGKAEFRFLTFQPSGYGVARTVD